MLTQEEALRILGREREYEERLVIRLFDYFIASIDNIPDISDIEADEIKKILEIIATDSQKHTHLFSTLMQMVLENGENNY